MPGSAGEDWIVRAIAIAIVLSGSGIEMAINGKSPEDYPQFVQAIFFVLVIAFFGCLIAGK